MFEDPASPLLKLPATELYVAVGCAVLLLLIVLYRKSISFTMLCLWYDIPLIGKLASLAKDHARAGNNWFRSELMLCQDFHGYYPQLVDRAAFDKSTSYLSKVTELGRREMPWYGWAVIFVLLVAEALSFGILLAGYAAQNASLRNQTQLGYLVAFVLAISLLALTHATGRQLHKNSLLRKAWAWRAADEKAGIAAPPLRPVRGVSLEQDSVDDDQPAYVQLAGRVPNDGRMKPSYVLPVVTVIIVALLAAGSVFIRTHVLDQLEAARTVAPTKAAGIQDVQDADLQGDANVLLGGAASSASPQEQEEAQIANQNAAMVAFGVLAVLFVLMQLIGVGAGMMFGFSGAESATAARIRRGFGTAKAFEDYQHERGRRIASIAQGKLYRLQQLLHAGGLVNVQREGIEHHTFLAYVNEQRRSLLEHDEGGARSPRANGGPWPPLRPVPAPISRGLPGSPEDGSGEPTRS